MMKPTTTLTNVELIEALIVVAAEWTSTAPELSELLLEAADRIHHPTQR